jgi:hypothetical protein
VIYKQDRKYMHDRVNITKMKTEADEARNLKDARGLRPMLLATLKKTEIKK